MTPDRLKPTLKCPKIVHKLKGSSLSCSQTPVHTGLISVDLNFSEGVCDIGLRIPQLIQLTQ